MDIKFTIKIKNKHNPPVFDKRLGKGVVATVTINYPKNTEKDLKDNPMFALSVVEKAQEYLNDYFEVNYAVEKTKTKKKK